MEVGHIKNTSRLAIASVICVICAITSVVLFGLLVMVGVDFGPLVLVSGCFSATAFVLGIIALVVISFRHKELAGSGYAVLAILLATPFIFMEVSSIYVAWVRAERKKVNTGLYNLEVLHKALVGYANDHDGYLPLADKWCDLLMEDNSEFTKDNFRHPKPERWDLKEDCHFAFNRNLSSMQLSDIPDDVILLFEADGDWNLNGTRELLKTRRSENGYIVILFVSGKTGDYWFYKDGVRKFDSKGTYMYHEQPRWKP